MQAYVELLATLPLIALFYQLYAYAANSKGELRQRRSRKLGIAYMTIGITLLIARELAFVVLGLVLIMMGFRLMAKGLDRLDKKIFIDRYDGHNNGSEPDEKGKDN
jgi:hypothetical protein